MAGQGAGLVATPAATPETLLRAIVELRQEIESGGADGARRAKLADALRQHVRALADRVPGYEPAYVVVPTAAGPVVVVVWRDRVTEDVDVIVRQAVPVEGVWAN